MCVRHTIKFSCKEQACLNLGAHSNGTLLLCAAHGRQVNFAGRGVFRSVNLRDVCPSKLHTWVCWLSSTRAGWSVNGPA